MLIHHQLMLVRFKHKRRVKFGLFLKSHAVVKQLYGVPTVQLAIFGVHPIANVLFGKFNRVALPYFQG